MDDLNTSLTDDAAWTLKVKQMDRLCRLHLDVSYEDCEIQGHYILVKLPPASDKLPLKKVGTSGTGLYLPETEKHSQIQTGLVLAYGRYAFVDGVATKWIKGQLCDVGDYIVFYTPEFIQTSINGYPVGALRDVNVMYKTKKPHLFGNSGIIGKTSARYTAKKIIYSKNDLCELGLECTDPSILFREDFEKVGLE